MLLRILSTLVLLSLLIGVASAAPPAADPFDLPQWAAIPEDLRTATGPVRVIVELEAPPAAELLDADTVYPQAAVAAVHAQIAQSQEPLLTAANTLGATVHHRYRTVLNGVALTVDAAHLNDLAAQPGVKRIERSIAVEAADTTSVPWVGAPYVWGGLNGATGDGVTIAVIDSGIDYYHATFGGAGRDAFAADDPTVIEPGSFPTEKVIAGIDLVGDDFDYTRPETARPDPDPLDGAFRTCGSTGHGTHIAALAAGYGVTPAGETYAGIYDDQVDFSAFRVGPGVAPDARLIAVRVFGCNELTTKSDVVIAGIDYAVEAGADVINLSIGSAYDSVYGLGFAAVDRAVQAGVIVVGAAGNNGDTHLISGGYGAADAAISVAASLDGGITNDAVQVDAPAAVAGRYDALIADMGTGHLDFTGPISAPVVPADPPLACEPLRNAAQIRGAIALIDRGTCTFVEKVRIAQAAGAVGVLIANAADGLFEMGIDGSDDIRIPALSIAKATGDRLKANLNGLRVTLDADLAGSPLPELGDLWAEFSSRGPRNDFMLKPDLAAPGDFLRSAAAGSGTGAITRLGTSYAAPHVAGAMAVLRELYPDWTPQELKALVMNSAVADLWADDALDAPVGSPARVGTGRLDLAQAARLSTIAYNSERPDLVNVSFGRLEITADTVITRTVTIENRGEFPAFYYLAYTPATQTPGISYRISPPTVNIPVGGSAEVSITLRADVAQLRHTADPTLEPELNNIARHTLSEAAGRLEFYSSPPLFYLAPFSGLSHVPPTDSPIDGFAEFSFDPETRLLNYAFFFDAAVTLSAAGARLHTAPAGANGPATATLLPAGAYAADTEHGGTITLSPQDAERLTAGELYVSLATEAHPNGAGRGQVAPFEIPSARVAIYASARPAARVAASVEQLALPDEPAGTGVIELRGAGLNTGPNLPTDIVSLVSAFELQHISPQALNGHQALGDLAAVGVSSDYPITADLTYTRLMFGVALHNSWSTPNIPVVRVHIDVDGSGVAADGTGAEYTLANYNGAFVTGTPDDVFVTVLIDWRAQRSRPVGLLNLLGAARADTALYGNNVMILSVPAPQLGLTPEQSRFTYRVVGLVDRQVVDDSGELRFDPQRPGLAFGASDTNVDGPVYVSAGSVQLPYRTDRTAVQANDTLGALLLHHHNATGERVELLPFAQRTPPGEPPASRRVYLPLLRR